MNENDIDQEVEIINNLTTRNQNDNEVRKSYVVVTKPGEGDNFIQNESQNISHFSSNANMKL
jgi:hypothetical protein